MNSLVVVTVCVAVVSAMPQFQDRIPNGHIVPNPCGGGFWLPVGHYSPTQHTVEKNPFGQAFKANNLTWTVDLCNMDSDGDGVSNGAELGDPTCVWVQGATPTNKPTGQPGICEPVDGTACSHQAFTCGCQGPACVGI